MPEGDTVLRTATLVHNALSGKTVVRSEFRHPRLATVDVSGNQVNSAHTNGKHIFVRFSCGLSLHSHLRMDGSWQVYRKGDRWGHPAHHARVLLRTDSTDAVGFRLHDMKVLPTHKEHELIAHLGPDLLDPQWSAELERLAVANLAAAGDQQLGIALLDQRIMAGVGNLYKTEICFLAGVSPWTFVSEVDISRVVTIARKLLATNAYRERGGFIQSTTGELARGRRTWVYERHRKGCFRCSGPVRVANQGNDETRRPTWFCPGCQQGPFPDR